LTLDDRSFTMSVVTTMDIPSSVVYFYPRLLPLQDLEPGSEELPAAIRCTSDKLRDDGVYLLGNITASCHSNWAKLAVDCYVQVATIVYIITS
jgi:hypothetical protein